MDYRDLEYTSFGAHAHAHVVDLEYSLDLLQGVKEAYQIEMLGEELTSMLEEARETEEAARDWDNALDEILGVAKRLDHAFLALDEIYRDLDYTDPGSPLRDQIYRILRAMMPEGVSA